MENKNEFVLLALGDIILGEDSPKFMEGVRPALKEADIRIGQLEVPYTTRCEVMEGLYREPWRLEPLANCMDILTLAGNHLYDAKEEGIEDTLGWLDANGLLHAGAGKMLQEPQHRHTEDKNPAHAYYKRYLSLAQAVKQRHY